MATEETIVQSGLEARATRNGPGAFGTVGDLKLSAFESQAAQGLEPSTPVMPTQPEAFADVAANPAFQLENAAPFLGEAKILPPPFHVSAPLVSELITAQTLAAAPQLSHFVPESCHTLRGDLDPPFRVD